MRPVLLFLIGTVSVLANNPVLICQEGKSRQCDCTTYQNGKTDILNIICDNSDDLNTTNVAVPDSLLNNVDSVEIIFDKIGISELNSPLLSGQLSKLVTQFALIRQNIIKIDANVFDTLPRLELLVLYYNEIDDKVLNMGWLTQTLGKTLKVLDLTGNNIKQIPKDLFSNLVLLEDLELDTNHIEQIPTSDAFAKPNKLTTLSLTNNQIKEIQTNAFSGFDKLNKLDLSHNQITQISDTAFDKLEQLQILLLDSNKIKQIPVGTFKALKKVYHVDISNNFIEQISAGFFDGLDSLSTLKINNNNIQKIDDGSLDKLTNLVRLELNNNKKLIFGDNTFGLSGFTQLEYLLLAGCNLQTLPVGILKSFPKLHQLHLQENQFTSVPVALRNTKSVQLLNLTVNNITDINSNAFGNNPSLTTLYLNNLDQLSAVADCSFCGLTGLKYVDLNNNNKMIEINENAFGFLKDSVDKTKSIETIDIHDGGLKTVPHKLLPWDKIRISILGNPANCDERMDWLFRNPNYNLDQNPTARYHDHAWCEQCMHDQVCHKVWDRTTKSESQKPQTTIPSTTTVCCYSRSWSSNILLFVVIVNFLRL